MGILAGEGAIASGSSAASRRIDMRTPSRPGMKHGGGPRRSLVAEAES
ncbi:hypothetical protein [Methanoculleus sp.]